MPQWLSCSSFLSSALLLLCHSLLNRHFLRLLAVLCTYLVKLPSFGDKTNKTETFASAYMALKVRFVSSFSFPPVICIFARCVCMRRSVCLSICPLATTANLNEPSSASLLVSAFFSITYLWDNAKPFRNKSQLEEEEKQASQPAGGSEEEVFNM